MEGERQTDRQTSRGGRGERGREGERGRRRGRGKERGREGEREREEWREEGRSTNCCHIEMQVRITS